MIDIKKPNKYWTKEKCHEEALKYDNIKELYINSISVYNVIIKNNWLDELCNHMIFNRKPNNYWTKEKCHEESLKYKYKKDFMRCKSENDIRNAIINVYNFGFYTAVNNFKNIINKKSKGLDLEIEICSK